MSEDQEKQTNQPDAISSPENQETPSVEEIAISEGEESSDFGVSIFEPKAEKISEEESKDKASKNDQPSEDGSKEDNIEVFSEEKQSDDSDSTDENSSEDVSDVSKEDTDEQVDLDEDEVDIFDPKPAEDAIDELDESHGAELDLDDDLSEVDGVDEIELEESKPKRKKKKRKKGLIAFTTIIALLAIVYGGGVFFYSSHFLPNTSVSGMDASNKTASEIEARVKESEANYTLTVKEKDNKTETISADQIDLKYADQKEVQTLLTQQSFWTWPAAFLSTQKHDLSNIFVYNESKLDGVIDKLNVLDDSEIVHAEDAHPVVENGNVIIKPEVLGNEVEKDAVNKVVKEAVSSGVTTVDITGCYKKPAFTSDSKEVETAKTTMEKYMKSSVTYTFGDAKEVVDGKTIGSWLNVNDDMNVTVDEDKVYEYLDTLSDKYDTLGGSHSFTTSGGSQITVSGGSFGWSIDEEGEYEALIPIIKEGKPVTREPVYNSKGVTHGANDIGNTYIEVSLDSQTMWCYVNGSCIVSTPVVTGCVAEGHATAGGVFEIAYMATDTNLVGEGYSSHVNFWMPFDTANGNGIHDADGWRSNYGGNIYVNSGSHGCVNTPYGATETIFNNVSDGTPVVVY